MKDNTPDFTPIQSATLPGGGTVYMKRDDLYCMAGIRGGKVRACWHLATRTEHDMGGLLGVRPLTAAAGLITASARKSPQAQIVARLAARLGIPARCHMPQGEKTEEMKDMEAHNGTLIQHKAGYNNVIIARALADAQREEHAAWRYIPFGMEHRAAMACTQRQAASIAHTMAFGDMPMPERLVICLGSGMSAAGVLHGLRDLGLSIPVVGVRIGADPKKRLDRFAPKNWEVMMDIVDVTPAVPYAAHVDAKLGGVTLDPHYEAKCLEYLQPGDLFWVVGVRATTATNREAE